MQRDAFYQYFANRNWPIIKYLGTHVELCIVANFGWQWNEISIKETFCLLLHKFLNTYTSLDAWCFTFEDLVVTKTYFRVN